MSWFYNLKVSAKLLLGFITIAVITLIVGYIGYIGISEIAGNQDAMYNDRLLPIQDLGYANAALLIARGDVVAMLGTTDLNKRKEYASSIEKQTKIVDDLIEKYSKTVLVKEEEETLPKFLSEWDEYKRQREYAVENLLNMKDAEAHQIIYGESLSHQIEARKNLRALIDINVKVASQLDEATDASVGSAKTFLIILVIIAALFAVGIGLFISKVISKPLNLLTGVAGKIAVGEVDVNVKQETNDETGVLMGAFAKLIENTKAQVAVAEKISDGDLNVEVNVKSDKDVLNKSFVKVVKTLKDLVNEATMLSKAGVEGKLSTRGNASNFKGGYKEIVQGVNETLDAVIKPVQEGAGVLEVMAKGDLTPRVTGNYLGDHQILKNIPQ